MAIILSSGPSRGLEGGIVGLSKVLQPEYTGIGLFSLLGSQLTSQMTRNRLACIERDSKVTKGGVGVVPR
jgi:hypothetical protein